VPLLAALLLDAPLLAAPLLDVPFEPGVYVLKNSIQEGSTELGSCWKRSYISSTSHSFAPKRSELDSDADTGVSSHLPCNFSALLSSQLYRLPFTAEIR
jgi:hypothetical protein